MKVRVCLKIFKLFFYLNTKETAEQIKTQLLNLIVFLIMKLSSKFFSLPDYEIFFTVCN